MLPRMFNNSKVKNQRFEAPNLSSDAKAFASWSDGKNHYRIPLGLGKHFIGSSEFATIRIKTTEDSICGFVSITENQVLLKCTGPTPTLFADGRRLKPGEVVRVGDIIEVSVGRHLVILAINAVSTNPAHMKERPTKSQTEAIFDNPDKLRLTLSRKLLDQMNLLGISLQKFDSPEVREAARLKLRKLVGDLALPVGFPISAAELEKQVYDEVMGLGPLEQLLADAKVTEIMVNRRDQIFIEKNGQLSLSNVNFSSDQALLNVIERIVSTIGRRIDQSSPIVDARLLDGSRVNAIIPPLAIKGPSLTIRRFSKTPISVNQLVEWKSLTAESAEFLRIVVQEHKNIIISGGTGSGKTTLLNALSSFIPDNERIVTVEDAAELQLQQEHVISLETRPPNLEGRGAITIRDLVKNTLRMRPDRIIVGECRGGEALDMLQAMNTGHDGSMTTAHANSPEDMLRRLETMVLMAGMELPLRAIREQIGSAITLIVQQTRKKSGKRLVTHVCWVTGLDKATGEYMVEPIFGRQKDDEMKVNLNNLKRFWQEQELSHDLNQFLGK